LPSKHALKRCLTLYGTPMTDRNGTALWLVLLAAAGTFALTMGTRQTMGLFLSPLNTATGLGLTSISLAFAFGQLWWGLTQPFAGAIADKIGAGRVLFIGALLVAVGCRRAARAWRGLPYSWLPPLG
jgi:MFS family permease